jgi:phosphoribosylanthranilate isomerase
VPRTRIKICGCYRPEDARLAAAAGADAIGMILHAKSPRLIEAEYAMAVAAAVPPLVTKVGVFVNAKAPFVANCARSLKLDLVQLHGDESIDFVRALPTLRVVKVVRVSEYANWANFTLPNLAALLLDSAVGGSGVENDWNAIETLLRDHPPKVPLFLAGGLKPENVGEVVRRFAPYAVDVSSGVEERVCEKSPAKINAFMRAVRDADVARVS